MKKIVLGNDFNLIIPVSRKVHTSTGDVIQDFNLLPACTDLQVNLVNFNETISLPCNVDVEHTSRLIANVDSSKLNIGNYALEVKGKIYGNAWRSNEYEQIAFVNNNASADEIFDGEIIEGELSVEVDHVFILLPPTVELSDLINKANDALKTNKETNDTLNANESARKEAEAQRVTAESERTNAEQSRAAAEEARVSAEGDRANAERGRELAEFNRIEAERVRVENENTILANERTRNDNEHERVNAEIMREHAEEERVTAENIRANSEVQRVSAENEREFAENGRASAETERVQAEKKRQSDTDTAIQDLNTHRTELDDAENERVNAENSRVEAEATRNRAEAYRADAEGERVKAEKTRADAEIKRKSDFDKAIRAAETATTGAETCNIEMVGSTISVTNRNGETKSVDVINTDEEVTVTIASSVSSINVSGIKINVFLNNGKTPQSYTTNAEGKATFTIDRGNYYQVVFPEYGNAQPIAPVGYTAVLGSRNINVEYMPYDEDSMEKVIITATKYVENVGTAWEGIPVIVTIDRKDTTYQTDAKGQVTVFVPYKKEYTVVINDQDGYNVSFNKNSRTYTANVPQRLIDYRFYQFKAGIFVVDANKNEYYIEDWVAAGRNADDAVAIKVADASLSINHGTFCIRTSDIKNVSKLISTSWCTQNLQFNSIALNGNNANDANYYNGESSSYLIMQEAQERSLSVPAFDYAYGQIFNLGGEDLHGFVMSVGQEYVHVANICIIQQVLETLYGETVATDYYNFVMNNWRWTSTQYSATSAWSCSSSADYYPRSLSFVVLPVFAC